jgi:hypothetical protein
MGDGSLSCGHNKQNCIALRRSTVSGDNVTPHFGLETFSERTLYFTSCNLSILKVLQLLLLYQVAE